MEMQDKEFDQLFNSRLDDFEMEPSPMVWQNIAKELDADKPVRSLRPYLSIAASIIVLVSAGLLFFNRTQQPTEDKPNKLVKLANRVKQQQSEISPGKEPLHINAAPGTEDVKIKEIAKATSMRQHKQLNVNVAPIQEAVVIPQEVVTEKPEPLLATAPAERVPALQATVPGNDIPLSTGLLGEEHPVINEKPHPVLANASAEQKAPAKKRAHGLGGLINTIVAAVDKRDDKLIEFTDEADDEGSKVTGINLGIFKIKKQ